MAFKSAKFVRFRIGSAIYRFMNVTYDDEAGVIDTTNSESDGYFETEDSGHQKLVINLSGGYDYGAGPVAALTPGALVSSVKLYLYAPDAGSLPATPDYTCATMRVQSNRGRGDTSSPQAKVELDVSLVSHGPYTRPTN